MTLLPDEDLVLPGIHHEDDDADPGRENGTVGSGDPSVDDDDGPGPGIQTGVSDLARRMRPCTMEDFLGQEHLVGEGQILRRLIESDTMPSMIFFGPAGCGKTALTAIIAKRTGAWQERLNAVTARLADVRIIIQQAEVRLKRMKRRTLLLLDEIHRFNKAQQDAFLPHVEEGTIILIGTTTENPYFAINAPLLSRMRHFQFKELQDEHVSRIIDNALSDRDRGLGEMELTIEPEAVSHIVRMSAGDVRSALKGLELAGFLASHPVGRPEIPKGAVITPEVAEQAMQRRVLLYDRNGDHHYDTASAFIKSVRGSDPDAALFWLAKMIVSGEDISFIARRLVILAAEDIGMADPMAAVVVNACVQAAERVGHPEAKIPLAEAVVYLACAPKSNSVYRGIASACRDVESGAGLEVPVHLKDASYPGAKQQGHGKGYLYPHDSVAGVVRQKYAPVNKRYYRPGRHGQEKIIAERLRKIEKFRGTPEEAAEPDRP